MTNQVKAIIKAQKVIQSCITEEHLDGAFRFLHNFAKTFSSKGGKRFGEQLWIFQEGAAEAYNELWLELQEKQKELSL